MDLLNSKFLKKLTLTLVGVAFYSTLTIGNCSTELENVTEQSNFIVPLTDQQLTDQQVIGQLPVAKPVTDLNNVENVAVGTDTNVETEVEFTDEATNQD